MQGKSCLSRACIDSYIGSKYNECHCVSFLSSSISAADTNCQDAWTLIRSMVHLLIPSTSLTVILAGRL